MPTYFFIGLTLLILMITVYATVAEEDGESTPADSVSQPDGDVQLCEQPQYRKAS